MFFSDVIFYVNELESYVLTVIFITYLRNEYRERNILKMNITQSLYLLRKIFAKIRLVNSDF